MGVVFGVLGDVEAWMDGERVDLGHARQRCVLAVLLWEADRVVSVDQLVERVWAERAPKRARTTLYGYLHRLRKLLPAGDEPAIVRRSGGYVLAIDPMAVDVHRFTELVRRARTAPDVRESIASFNEALALWRGDAFAGLDIPWLDAVRAGLDRQRLAAELDRNDLALQQGRHAELVTTLPGLAAAHPLDERLAGQLMLALYRGGRQAEALQHYLHVRDRLAEELGTDPGAPLRRVHRQILGADLDPVPAPAALPHQLPAPPSLFTGRADELAVLDKAVESGCGDTVVISSIGGAGGIGKTWLALHWAHRRLDRFPDGQLYVDLRGFDPVAKPTPPAVALRWLLSALGAEPEHTGEVDEFAARYRSLLAARRMLVVLDNAHDADQVVPLLPGTPTCAVLITSRHQLSGLVASHGAHLVTLDAMSAPEAGELLTRHLGQERVATQPDAVSAILDHCAGLPLALSIAAARAAAHPHFPLSALAEELHDDRLDSLRAVFAASYRALDTEATRVFRLLGAAPGPDIELRAAAALTGISVPQVRAVLRRLEIAHLVDRREVGRYRMHDLVRLFAAEQDTDIEAVHGLVDFYSQTAHAADRILSPNSTPIAAPGKAVLLDFADADAAMAWLDAEHECLLAAQAWAVRHDAYPVVWHLAWALDTFHWRRGLLDTHLMTWRAGVAAGRHLDDSTLAQGHRRLSHALLRAGDHDAAFEQLHAALAVHERTGAVLDEGHVTHDIAATQGQRGNLGEAVAYAERALVLYREADAKMWEANALNTLGWFQSQRGDHERGRAHCARAVVLCRALGYREGEAAARDSLGHIAHTTGAHRRALGHYRHALRLRRALGDTYEEADALMWLGKVHTALDQHAEAHTAWHQAIALYRTQSRHEQVAQVTDLLGSESPTTRPEPESTRGGSPAC
jgi:DNA-binding SARP family transcriptional activator/DNA-binding transcriptional ArsR family regulator